MFIFPALVRSLIAAHHSVRLIIIMDNKIYKNLKGSVLEIIQLLEIVRCLSEFGEVWWVGRTLLARKSTVRRLFTGLLAPCLICSNPNLYINAQRRLVLSQYLNEGSVAYKPSALDNVFDYCVLRLPRAWP